MADQPQNPQAPNTNRISSMLQDLADQRSNPPGAPRAPAGGPLPPNLPVAGKIAPPVQPAPVPAGAVPPPRPAVPPAPRELPVMAPPKPAAPPIPPPPPVQRPVPVVPKPVTPPAAPQVTSELRTMTGDIGQIQVGRPPAGVRPAAPAVPSAPGPIAPAAPTAPIAPSRPVVPQIAVPPESAGRGRKLLFIGLGVVILVVLVAIVSSFLGGTSEPTPTATPTPTSSATLAPLSRNLISYFGNPSATIALQQASAADDLRNALLTAQPPAGRVVGMSVQMDGSALSPKAFLEAVLGSVPSNLTAALGSDMAVMAFGQTEAYDASGALTTATTVPTRLALVMEVTDASAANQAMMSWEGTGLASVSESIFDYRLADRIVEGFSPGTYREIPVRYWNFPYADRSLDWAITLGANGKNYLILTGSRESAFFAIDQLMQ